jgi:putative transcriptional regulator
MIKCNLSRLLGEKKWTQADLARRAGVRPNTISALYNEFIDRVSLKQLDKICEILGCNLSDLLEYLPPKKEHEKR